MPRVLAVLVLLAAAASAHASPGGVGPITQLPAPTPPPPLPDVEKEKARELFAKGNELMRDALFPRAAAMYRDALTHWDHPAIHFNLALALINLDQPVAVHDALTAARKYGPGAIGDAPYERAGEMLLLVTRLIASVEITLNEPGAHLFVDGKEVFVGPGTWTGRLGEGEHQLRAEVHDKEPVVQEVRLLGGERSKIEMKLYTTIIEYPPRRDPLPRWVPYVMITGGFAAAAMGGVASRSDNDAVTYTCLGAGGALVVAGLTVLIYERPYTPRSGYALAPMLGPDGAGIAAAGRF